LPPIEGVEIVKGNREFKATLENVQFVKLYQNAEEVIEKLRSKNTYFMSQEDQERSSSFVISSGGYSSYSGDSGSSWSGGGFDGGGATGGW